MPRYALRQLSVSPTIAWRSYALVTASPNSASLSGAAGEKASSSAVRALCFCWQMNLRLAPCREAKSLTVFDRAKA